MQLRKIMYNYTLLNASLYNINTTLFANHVFGLSFFFMLDAKKSEEEFLDKCSTVMKETKAHFFETLIHNMLDDLYEGEQLSKKNETEHPILFYRFDFTDIDHGNQSLEIDPFVTLRNISKGIDKPKQIEINYKIPNVKLTGLVQHKHVLPIRNGVYHPSESFIELSNITLKANFSTTERPTDGPGWKKICCDFSPPTECDVDFELSITETDRYKLMPVERVRSNLKEILCQKALRETLENLYGPPFYFLGSILSNPLMREGLKMYESGEKAELIFKYLESKEAAANEAND